VNVAAAGLIQLSVSLDSFVAVFEAEGARLMSAPPPRDKKPVVPFVKNIDDEPTAIGRLDSALLRAQSQRDRAHLIVLAGNSLGRMFRLDQPETFIGRATDATIRLEDDGVSRRHAKIVQSDGEVWVEDLKSANGTLINGQRVDRQHLQDGDKIQMGATTILKFTYSDRLEENFQQKMIDAALHDGLTGAYNKRYLLERLPTEVAYAMRHKTPLSLLMVDVDHFKAINDKHGHPGGDYVLTTLAQLVMGALRTEDLFARYGGEEFAVLCRNVKIESACVLANRLRSLIESCEFSYRKERIAVTVSVGVSACAYQNNEDPALLIADADAALYEAKRTGRNRVVAAPLK
jgi:diguanylate cyclase (GGDEF)-like protein